jgi:hypothetical protein
MGPMLPLLGMLYHALPSLMPAVTVFAGLMALAPMLITRL